jgi:signal transduction histidine kinase
MIFDLRRQDDSNRRLLAQVEGARRDLERRVAEATLDLRDKNAALLKAQDELVRVQQDVGKLEKLASLGQLSTTLAHELSTPLNVVLGHLELLDMELGRAGLPRERVRTVTGQVYRLVGILKEMLSMVKLPEPRLSTVSLRSSRRGHGALHDPFGRVAPRTDRPTTFRGRPVGSGRTAGKLSRCCSTF